MVSGQTDIINAILSMKFSIELCFYPVKELAKKRFPDLSEEDCEKLQTEIEALLKRINQLISTNYYERSVSAAVKKELPNVNLDVIENAVSLYFISHR